MKKSLFLIGLLPASLLTQQSCSDPVNTIPAVQCHGADTFVKAVESASGIIWYNVQRQQYQIQVATSNLDSQDVSFVCNLPDAYKEDGLRVTFSGRYYEFKENIGRVAGASYYYLTVKQIAKL